MSILGGEFVTASGGHEARDAGRQPGSPGPGELDPAILTPTWIRERLLELEPLARADSARIQIARAPGRVNLIGEHTDYNDGLVLPAAIGLEIWLAFVPTEDRRVELVRLETGERGGFDLDAIGLAGGDWLDYPAGVAWALRQAGQRTHGLRGVVASTLPISAGLSSSAAMELASAWALSGPAGPTTDGMTLARIAQRAENAYVGNNCGLMDQFASSLGRAGMALLLDCRSLAYRPIPLPLDEVRLVVCHTGSPRRLLTSEYNARRARCEWAVEFLRERGLDVRALRDVAPAMLPELRSLLDAETFARVEHVVTENERVLETVAALEARDLTAVGRLFAASHASLRDRYEVSSPELDALVEIASTTEGVVAARMTGAGFGGCTVNLVRPAAVDRLREAVLREYPKRTGLVPRVFAVEPVAGAGFLQ